MRALPRPRERGIVFAAAVFSLLVAGCAANTGRSASSTTTTSSLPASIAPYLPLWPFRTAGEVASWQQEYRADGTGKWHVDASETALRFVEDYLEFGGIDMVVKTTSDSAGAHVSVGYQPKSGVTATAAVVHVVRWGTDATSPWEVVGTDDSTFSLTTPRYGATTASPLSAGGRITGVDESIRVAVRQPSSSTTLGAYCCQPAGGTDAPWSAAVEFTGATDPVLTVVASTGGHLQAVERFTVTGALRPAS
jgi:hypothetical protein